MSHRLSATIHHGLVNRAGITPQAHKLVEALLEDDRKRHHCYFNNMGFHNHLSHHLLAAYDLGASAKLLQTINDDAADGVKTLLPIQTSQSELLETVTRSNWTEFLGKENYYVAYLEFFLEEVGANGAEKTLESFIFNPEANGNGSEMFSRLLGGIFHPMIQIGYGAEFKSDAMVAQGLAQAAVHQPFVPALFEFNSIETSTQDRTSLPLFEIIRQFYESETLAPVMPYNADALVSVHVQTAAEGGRPEAIRKLVSRWFSTDESISDLSRKHEELMWFATLQLAGTGKPGRKPRPDFFLMHVLTSSLFLPSLNGLIPDPTNQIRLFKGFLSVTLFLAIIRGRPRINPDLLMSYTATPEPPTGAGTAAPKFTPSSSAVGDPNDIDSVNPWDVIIPSVLHAPDSHIVKAIRALHYASQLFGFTSAGDVPGAIDAAGNETIQGMKNIDGTVFVRAAGVLMDHLGWVTHGQQGEWWDGSGLGWDDAWNNGENVKP